MQYMNTWCTTYLTAMCLNQNRLVQMWVYKAVSTLAHKKLFISLFDETITLIYTSIYKTSKSAQNPFESDTQPPIYKDKFAELIYKDMFAELIKSVAYSVKLSFNDTMYKHMITT